MHVARVKISSMQGRSIQARSGNEPYVNTGGHKLVSDPGPSPKHCQWIDGNPSRKELRRYGSDKFKCMAPTKHESSYCPTHHARCYITQKAVDTADVVSSLDP